MDKDSKKFNLREYIWLGFNITCSITFTTAFAGTLVSSDPANPGLELGVNLIWIFLLSGIVAAVCAWSFCRLSQSHNISNGGAYIYIRGNFGRFTGWIIAFIQYISFSMIISYQLVSMIRSNFITSKTFLDTFNTFGNWSYIFWDSISILIFISVSFFLFFGMNLLKKWLNFSSYIKWGASIILIIAIIILIFYNGTSGINENINHSKISLQGFSNSFTSCFFFFLGFESIVTIGGNVQNPKKNISKSIVIIMILSTLFYLMVTILFLFAIVGGYSTNPNLQIFKILGNKTWKWLYPFGVIIMLICSLSLKINSISQISLYAGSTLEALANEGFISYKYSNVDDDNLPTKAIFQSIIVTLCILIIWLIIPDLIQGILNESRTIIAASILNGDASFLLLIVYLFVISAALKCAYKKQIKSNWFEIIIWIAILIFLLFEFEEFFRNNIILIIYNIKPHLNSINIENIIQGFMEIILLIFIVGFSTLWYKFYYVPFYKMRLKENPELQKKLDDFFKILVEKKI